MARLPVAILSTHPIQYQAPWFRALAAQPDLDVTVLFAHLPTAEQQGVGFGRAFEWDQPLLEGYRHHLLDNVSAMPALSTFAGCDTPTVGRVLEQVGAQAVIINGWYVKAYVQGLAACRRRGIPCLVRGESNTDKPRRPWIRLLHRLLLRQYSAFLSIGKGNHAFYRRNGVPEAKLFFAPYCVDNAFFEKGAAAARSRRDQLRAAWGIPPGAVVALFAGKLIEKKRPFDLIRATALARTGGSTPGLYLLVVGDGPLRDRCLELMKELEVPGAMLGFLNQSRMPEAYVAADALVLPSDHGETWGLVVNEGMACGLPAAVSDQVGCRLDLVVPGETGAVFPLGDVPALAQTLSDWARNASEVTAQGARAHARIQRYSITELVCGTRAALEYATRGH